MKAFIIFLFASFFCCTCQGQQKEYIFKNFTQEEGLPSNEAYYIFEDSKHFLWFATDLGVVRYNGSKFEKFNLPDKVVFKIWEDNKGRIWFFSHTAQLAFFENEKIYEYEFNNIITQRISKINIVDAYVDAYENVFFSSSLDSNYTIDNTGKISASNHITTDNRNATEFRIEYTGKSEKYFTANTNLSPTSKNNNVVISLRDAKRKNYQIKVPVKHSRSISHFGCIKIDNAFYLFAGSLLVKFELNGNYKTKIFDGQILSVTQSGYKIIVGTLKSGGYLLDNDFKSIPDTIFKNKSVTCSIVDHEKGAWFSTLENGIFYLKNENIVHYTDAKLFPDLNLFRLLNVNDSLLFYTNSSGIYSLENNKKNTLLFQNNNNISDLILVNDDIICAGGFQKNIPYYTRRLFSKNISNALFIESPSELILKNDTIVATHSNCIAIYPGMSKKPLNLLNTSNMSVIAEKKIFNKPLKLFIDKDNVVWGGYSDGLYRAPAKLDTFFHININSETLKKGISCIRQMTNGFMVVGIRFGGIAILNDTSIVANITEKEGLLNDKIRYMLPINNQLWVATAMGISVIKFSSFNPVKYSIINIGKNDGFYNVTINQLIKFKGDIVAATSNGLYFIKAPDELINRKPISIPFHINSVSYYQNDTSTAPNLDLPYSKSRVLLRYSAACFNSADEIKYQYTFSSQDTGWTTTTSNELLLENLEPGNYDLKIKAVIPNQFRSSEVQHFHITVEKPWWQNNWLRAAVILAFLSAGIFFTRYRIKKVQAAQEKKTALNAKIAELEQTALRAQMNPHFIFNCLTSIQQLIVTGDKTEANEYLVKFARLIRKTLDLSANPFISIKEEIEYLGEYMFLEQLRITGRFKYFIKADYSVDIAKTYIPNMMIQPVVENCIRHGIKSLENKKGIINVDFNMVEGNLICKVQDNGIGRVKSINENLALVNHKSYGIDIIEKRLKVFGELNDQQMGIEIKDLFNEDGSPAGTEVILQLPYKAIG